MINTPLRQKKEDDQKIKPANHLECNKMEKKPFVNTTFYTERFERHHNKNFTNSVRCSSSPIPTQSTMNITFVEMLHFDIRK